MLFGIDSLGRCGCRCRRPRCRSRLSEMAAGTGFAKLIGGSNQRVRRLVLASGKIGWDLEDRLAETDGSVAVVRVEELYPFPFDPLRTMISRMQPERIAWCQEEARNQGAWHYVSAMLDGLDLGYAGRPEMAATAGGFVDVHAEEQAAIVTEALGL